MKIKIEGWKGTLAFAVFTMGLAVWGAMDGARVKREAQQEHPIASIRAAIERGDDPPIAAASAPLQGHERRQGPTLTATTAMAPSSAVR